MPLPVGSYQPEVSSAFTKKVVTFVLVNENKKLGERYSPFSKLLPQSDVKFALQRIRFEPVEDVKEKATYILQESSQEDFHHCLKQQKIRMERYKDRDEVCVEGDHK
ncbi:hypothetical protein TNCV_3714031 [Trichonephila clavipes]|nr:hypothetical protein TNCV_3714031 [Trichonephila clavipes]